MRFDLVVQSLMLSGLLVAGPGGRGAHAATRPTKTALVQKRGVAIAKAGRSTGDLVASPAADPLASLAKLDALLPTHALTPLQQTQRFLNLSARFESEVWGRDELVHVHRAVRPAAAMLLELAQPMQIEAEVELAERFGTKLVLQRYSNGQASDGTHYIRLRLGMMHANGAVDDDAYRRDLETFGIHDEPDLRQSINDAAYRLMEARAAQPTAAKVRRLR